MQRLGKSQGLGNAPAPKGIHRYILKPQGTWGKNSYHNLEAELHVQRAAKCLPGAIFFSQGMQPSQVKPAGKEPGEQTLWPHSSLSSLPPVLCCGFLLVTPNLKPEGREPIDERKQGGYGWKRDLEGQIKNTEHIYWMFFSACPSQSQLAHLSI